MHRALEDCHRASDVEQGQEGKSGAKGNGESKDGSKGDARKGKREKDRDKVKEIGLEVKKDGSQGTES